MKLALAFTLMVGLGMPGTAWAIDDQVVILRVGEVTPPMQEAVARMQGELAAAGFVTLLLDAQTTTNVIDEIDAINRVVEPAATFALQAQSGVAEVWFSDRRTGQHVSQMIDLAHEPARRVPLVLAVRAVEFLRGHLSIAPARRSQAHATSPLPAAAPSLQRWSFGLGALLFAEGTFKALSVAPSARAAILLSPHLSLDVLAAGWGSEVEFSGPRGTAVVRRTLAALGCRLHNKTYANALQAFVGLAAAAHHLAGTGEPNPGFAGAKADVWAPGVVGEFGARYMINPRFWVEFAAAVSRMLPPARVRLGDETQQHFGSASLLAGLTLGATL